MEKEKALELLQDDAREIAALVERFKSGGMNRLAEYATMWHLVNFKFQEIISSSKTKEKDVFNALVSLEMDLFSKMENFREKRITALAELYGAALDGFAEAKDVIADYLI